MKVTTKQKKKLWTPQIWSQKQYAIKTNYQKYGDSLETIFHTWKHFWQFFGKKNNFFENLF